jgi:small subunit ribosomal protein S19
MGRSKWKGPFVDASLLKGEELKSKTWSRRSIILPQWVGQKVEVHSGWRWVKVDITEEKVGYRLGSFVPTKKSALYPAKKKKK